MASRRAGGRGASSSNFGQRVTRSAVATVEPLERRSHLSGTWTALASTAPSSVGTMLVLSDGSVIAQRAGVTNVWYKLTPSASGSYQAGTWTTLASSSLQRLYTATQILPDGRLWMLGGEYSGPSGTANWTNTAEIYNPVSNTWTTVASHPESQYGDVPSAVLNDGRILAGSLSSAATYIYNPATNTWVTGPTKLFSDRSDEETWIKLPDGSILSYDIFGSAPKAQRYIPSTTGGIGTWVAAGTATASLATPNGAELGPGLLLPDGRAIQFGGLSANSIYSLPTTNGAGGSWTAAATTPNSLGGNDTPGVMLPNGHILLVVGDTSTNFNAPAYFYEYDPVGNTLTAVAAPTGGTSTNVNPFVTRFLMLPNGQALFTYSGNQLYLWTGDGAPSDSWRPTISNITANADGSFQISGKQLNGISEGASYGDDAQMSANYPIVKTTDAAGTVRYARSYGWSSAWVQTGTNTVTANFTLPTSVAAGAYLISVSGAGIATANNTLNVEVTASTSSITLRTDPSDSTKTQVLAGANSIGSFLTSGFNKIIVSGNNSGDTVRLAAGLTTSVPIIVNGGSGNDTVIVESQGLLSNLTANLGTGTDLLSLQVGTFAIASDLGALAPNLGIASGATVSITAAQALASLTSTSGTSLTLGAAVTISSFATLGGAVSLPTGGSISGAGTVTFSSGSVLSWTGGSMIGAGKTVFALGATANLATILPDQTTRPIDNGGTFSLTSGAFFLSGSAAVFSNLAGATFNLGASSAIGFATAAGSFSNAGTFNKTGGTSNVTVPFANVGTVNLNSGALAASAFTQTAGTLNYNATGGFFGPSGLTLAGGTIIGNADLAGLSLSLLSGASATFSVPETIGTLAVATGATAALATGGQALAVKSLSINGKLDLADGFLVVDYSGASSPLPQVFGLLAAGYNSGAWTGPGISSSLAAADTSHLHAIGYAESSLLLNFSSSATVSWHGVQVDSSAVLVRYTYLGDTDLSGVVDGSDLANLDAGLHGGLAGWVNGDMNYNSGVTNDDRNLLLYGLSSQGAPLGDGGDGGAGASAPAAIHGVGPHLGISGTPGTVVAGRLLPKMTVQLLDASGQLVTADRSKVQVTILSGPGNATLLGASSAQVRKGTATFSNNSVRLAGTYVLQFSDDGYAPVTTAAFSVTPASAAKLVFSSVPAGVSVTLADRYGNAVDDDASVATLVLGSGSAKTPFSAALSDGTALFSDVSLPAAGAYSLVASVGKLKASSRKFALN